MASMQNPSPSTISSYVEEVEVLMTPAEIEAMKKSIFKNVMKGKWKDVLTQYKKPQAQGLKITKSGDTVLHLAVFDGEIEIVQKLVKVITDANAKEILTLKNKKGDTVLHLAAAMGYVEMCECIVERDPSLIGERNDESETPLFLAAHHGQKEAFLCLNSRCGSVYDGLLHCRRKDGETVLHCAINGEYFDLAYHIIQLYGDLVNYNNEKGVLPLHILASKHNAFKSGNRLRRFDLLIYYCIFVDNPDSDPTKYNCSDANGAKNFDDENVSKYCPRNYQVCFAFFEILRKLITIITISMRYKHLAYDQDTESTDTENPKLVQKTCPAEEGGSVCGRQDEQKNQSDTKKNIQWPQSNGTSIVLPPPPKIYPPNCEICFYFLKLAMKTLLVILGLGFSRVRKIKEKKEKNTWATRIMEELIERASSWEYDTYAGGDPGMLLQSQQHQTEPGETTPTNVNDLHNSPPDGAADHPHPPPPQETQDKKGHGKMDSPILIAARMGVIEMVDKLLDKFPMAIQDTNPEKKNIVLLAVENRQPHVYELLCNNRKSLNESVFRQLDNKGNSALHLAATLGEHRPWLIPGAALQMQWEIRWYKFVKGSKPRNYFIRYNEEGKTAKQVFSETHKDLVKDGGQWLTNTSESCSVVAALIATVAFATAATVPGGLDSTTGTPTLEGEPAFDAFAISSLVALCFSVTGVIMFLAILTSRYEEKDFASDLPHKLLLGLSSLFISIASMLVSFCAGHFFVLKDKVRYAAYPLYAVTFLPVIFFVAAQFPLYVDLIKATLKKVPQRSYKVIPIDVEHVPNEYKEHGSGKKPHKKEEKKHDKSIGKHGT